MAAGQIKTDVPRIPLNLRDHKTAIAINWTILYISGGALPIILYFTLRYAAHLELATVLGVTTAIFGAVSLFSLIKRTWALAKRQSTCRPQGGSRWGMDYFNWNFLIGFCAITAVIVAGNITLEIRIVTLGLPILLCDVCAQLLLTAILAKMGVACPIRVSSVARGEKIRSGVYAIAEDIVAVDGGQGQLFREQLQERYLYSKAVRRLCFNLDILWGTTGLLAAGLTMGLIFGLPDANAAYIMGWAIPWAYAGIMTLVTIWITKVTLKNEQRDTSEYPDIETVKSGGMS